MTQSVEDRSTLVPPPTTSLAQSDRLDENSTVPCLVCGSAIPAAAFRSSSTSRDVVAADCPRCNQLILVPKVFWSYFSGTTYPRVFP